MITVTIEKVNPEIAKRYLLSNSSNRKISEATVSAYAKDMASGSWKTTHQGIAFYDDGSLADGQHRLRAVIKSNSEIETMVTRGIEKNPAIDRNRPRSISDCASIVGLNWIDKNVVAIITVMFAKTRVSRGKFTVDELIPIAERYQKSIQTVLSIIGARMKGVSHSGVSAACVTAIECGVAEEKIERFISVLKTGIAEQEHEHPIIKLRDFLLLGKTNERGSGSRIEIFLKAQRAIKAFDNKEKLTKIYTPEDLIYRIQPENAK